MIGIPAGLLGAVLSILGASPGPLPPQEILEELQRRGHRISLAGLDRILQQCAQSGLTTEGPDGVKLRR
jgi:Fe2+ or Zn2+ uptake regulation protein